MMFGIGLRQYNFGSYGLGNMMSMSAMPSMQSIMGFGSFSMGSMQGYSPFSAFQGMSSMGMNFLGQGQGMLQTEQIPMLGIGQRTTAYGNTQTNMSLGVSWGSGVSMSRTSSTPIYEYEKQAAVDYHFQLGQQWHNKEVQVSRQSRSYDPVILDLNGDGQLDVTGKDNSEVQKNVTTSSSSKTTRSRRRITTETTNVKEWDTYKDWNNKINYDVDGDGTVDRTEWMKEGSKDGMLVMDVDGDGQITGNELMNESDIEGKTGVFQNGFEKARYYGDANKDGKISGAELNKFKVWVDANGDGVTDSGELKSASSLNIVEIDTVEGSFVRRKEVGKLETAMGYNSNRII